MSDQLGRLRAVLGGRYEVRHELGSGGMATVYLARDARHERDVAIKVLHPDLGAALGSERFLAEIRTTASLQHPHILPLLDSGDADGLLYYVMPYVTGESLRDRLQREQQLPIQSAIAIAREIADALGAAHELGIVHRDIKPENILLRGNHAIVADFGIALAVHHAGAQRMTQTGLSLGTPQYMSPEQAMGERTIGPRSDIYSLGAVTYEMIAGDPPFTGHSVQAIVAKVMTERPTPLSTVRNTVPAYVEDAVEIALSKLPADRFASAHEFAAALADELRVPARRTISRAAAPAGKIRHRLRDPVVMVLGAVVIALAGLSSVLAMRFSSREAVPVTRVALAFPEAQRLVPQWRGFNIALSKDGSRLAYIGPGTTRNTQQLLIRSLDALEASPVPGTVGATSVRFSPDGGSVLISGVDDPSAGGTATLISLDGGKRTEFSGVGQGDIGASGRVYAPSADSQSVMIIRQMPGGARDTLKVSSLPISAAQRLGGAVTLTVVPDESAVLLTVSTDTAAVLAEANIVGVSLSTGKATVVGKGVFAQYLASGHLLYVTSTGDVFVAPFDARAFRIKGIAKSVARVAITSNSGRLYPQITASENGTLAYISGEMHRQRLAWLDQNGRVTSRLSSEGNFWGIALSPDGSRVALAIRQDERARGSNYRGVGDVFVEDLRTGARTRLTSAHFNARPSWSADGDYVLYARVGGPHFQSLFERRADASLPERLVTSAATFGNSVGDGRWLPDHRTLIVRTYESRATGSRDIFFMSTGGTDSSVTPVVATPAEEYAPAVSRDGSMIAYVSNETGLYEIYVQRFPSGAGRLRISNGGGDAPRWSRDGRLYYWDNRSRLLAVSIQPSPSLAILGVREIGGDIVPTMAAGGSTIGYDIAPDGRILVTEALPQSYSVVLVRNWLADLR